MSDITSLYGAEDPVKKGAPEMTIRKPLSSLYARFIIARDISIRVIGTGDGTVNCEDLARSFCSHVIEEFVVTCFPTHSVVVHGIDSIDAFRNQTVVVPFPIALLPSCLLHAKMVERLSFFLHNTSQPGQYSITAPASCHVRTTENQDGEQISYA
jgi:hypothetical protein